MTVVCNALEDNYFRAHECVWLVEGKFMGKASCRQEEVGFR